MHILFIDTSVHVYSIYRHKCTLRNMYILLIDSLFLFRERWKEILNQTQYFTNIPLGGKKDSIGPSAKGISHFR